MYDLDAYARMIMDPARMDAYGAALGRLVGPGTRVLDMGTGTGIFALLACRLGAKVVYALEPSDAVHLGARLAEANGCEGRIRFLRRSSFDLALPEPVDLVISDLRGVLPLFGRHIPAVVDARDRLLAPGGALLPMRDRIWAGLVSLPDWYGERIEGLDAHARGLDLSAMRRALCNATYRVRFGPESLVAEPRLWGELDYGSIRDPNLEGVLEWNLPGPARIHGVGLWFDCEVDGRSGFSSAPGAPDTIYGRLLLPLKRPLGLLEGDRVRVGLRANLVADAYVWRWDTRVAAAGRDRVPGPAMRQSTFFSGFPSPADLALQSETGTPARSPEGEVTYFVLSAMDGQCPMAEIAVRLRARFPDRFPRPDDASRAVKSIALELGAL